MCESSKRSHRNTADDTKSRNWCKSKYLFIRMLPNEESIERNYKDEASYSDMYKCFGDLNSGSVRLYL